MREKILEIQAQLESMEEELTDMSIQSLAGYLDTHQNAESSDAEALKSTKDLEKAYDKARRAIQKARNALTNVHALSES